MARDEYEKIDFDRISLMDEVQTIPLNPRQSFYLGKPQDHAASP